MMQSKRFQLVAKYEFGPRRPSAIIRTTISRVKKTVKQTSQAYTEKHRAGQGSTLCSTRGQARSAVPRVFCSCPSRSWGPRGCTWPE